MDFTRTRGADWLTALGGLVLLVSLFLPWYEVGGVGFSALEALAVIDVLVGLYALAAIVVPFVTASRDASPVPLVVDVSVAMLGTVAVLLVLFRVLVTPGGDLVDVGRQWGLWVGLIAVIVTAVGAWRAIRDERAPGLKPAPEPERQPTPPAQSPS